jgi:hypothetical protein
MSNMAANVPRDVDAMVDCTVPIIVTILTCWFMEWLRRGRQAQVDKKQHDEQMAMLRKIETGSFILAPRSEIPAAPRLDGVSLNRSEKPTTSQPDGVSLSRNDKLSKLQVDFIGMLEDCAKLQETHHGAVSQLEVNVQIANEENTKLQKDLQKAQASLKLSEKEAFDAKAKQIQVANDAAAKLNALQSKYDTAVVDLKAAESNARRVTFAQQSNGSHDDSAAELQALQARYDEVVQDLRTARDDADRISLGSQSNHDHDDLFAELEVMQAKYKQAVRDLAISEVRAQEMQKNREIEKTTASDEPEDDTAEKLKDLKAENLQAVKDREDAEIKASEEQAKRITTEIKYNDTVIMLEELKPCLEQKEKAFEQLKKEKKELEKKVLNLEQGVYSDIEEATRKEFSETSDKLQTQLGKLEDENKQLKEKIDTAEKRYLELETSTKTTLASRNNESGAESPVPAEVYRSHLDFERRLSKTEEDIRKVQSSLSPVASGRATPTSLSFSPTRSTRAAFTTLSPPRSGRASPTSPTRAWSALGKLPADPASSDNMDLYESPSSALLSARRGSTTTTRTRPSAPRSKSGPPSPLFGSRPSSRHGPASASSQSSRTPSAFEGRLEFGMEFNKPLSASSSSAAGPSSPRAPSAPRAEQRESIFEDDTW